MKITPQSGMVPMTPMTHKARGTSAGSTVEKAGASSGVSNAAQLLARNQSQLEERLSTREEVIQRFSGSMTDSVHLQERTIDLIIQRLKNT